jgi:hypothetical protein
MQIPCSQDPPPSPGVDPSHPMGHNAKETLFETSLPHLLNPLGPPPVQKLKLLKLQLLPHNPVAKEIHRRHGRW